MLQEIVNAGTKYLIDVPLNYLSQGLGQIGLDAVGNVIGNAGNYLSSGLNNLAAGNFAGGLGDLYGGLDTVVGGVLPGGQNLAQGYVGQLYTGADKMLGGALPNFGGVGYVDPAAAGAIGGVMPGGTTSGAGMGAGGSVGATGPMGPAGAGVAPQSGVTTTLYRGGVPAGSLTQPTSEVIGGAGSSFLDKAMGAAQLAATVGGVAAMLDGGGGGGGGNPAAGRPKPSRSGGALQASRRMGAPAGGVGRGAGAGASSGGGMSGGGGSPSGGISGLGEGEVSEGEKLAAFNSLVAGGMPADEAQDVVDALTKGSADAFEALMPGSGGTQNAEDIDVSETNSRSMEIAKEMEDLEREVNKLAESVEETEEAVEAQEEAEEVEEGDVILDALRPQSDIPGGPRAEYLSNPSVERAMEILPLDLSGSGDFFSKPL